MNPDHLKRDEKIIEVFREVFRSHDDAKDGTVNVKKLVEILASLGRRVEPEYMNNPIFKKFDENSIGKIEWNNLDFLRFVALMDVDDVSEINERFFELGFKAFDEVRSMSYQLIN